MTQPRILVAGIGNIFLGDDAFGGEVARKLAARSWPDGVRVEDFGIRGFDLAYALLEGYDVAILIDVTQRGERPGTLYTIEPDLDNLDALEQEAAVDTHGMHPAKVLAMARALDATFGRVLLVGCEPETFGPEDEGCMGLSVPVQAAVDEAVRMVESLVSTIRDGNAGSETAVNRVQTQEVIPHGRDGQQLG